MISFARLGLLLALCTAAPAAFAAAITASVMPGNDTWAGRPSYVVPGGSATLRATQLSDRGEPIDAKGNVQWSFNGAPIPGATTAQFTLAAVSSSHVGNYVARVTADGIATDSSAVVLNVAPRPTGRAVDPGFVSVLEAIDAVYFDSIRPLSDGGAFLSRINYNSTGLPHTDFRIRADGSTAPLPPVISNPNPARKLAAYLADGSVLMSLPPYRASTDDQPAPELPSLPGLSNSAVVTGGTLQPDGKLLVAYGPGLLRLTAGGQRDLTFSFPGSPTLPAIYRLFIDSTGRIIVSGGDSATGTGQIIRLTATGAIDSSFTAIAAAPYAPITLLDDGGLMVGFTRYNASGVATETWDINAWLPSGLTPYAIAPNGDLYIALSGIGVIRLHGGPVLELDPTFFAMANEGSALTALTLQRDGKLLVAGVFSSWEGHTTRSIARLDTTNPSPMAAPIAAGYYLTAALSGGTPVTVRACAGGTGPLTYAWLSLDGGKLPDDSTSRFLTFPSFQGENAGRYQLRVTGPGGSALGPIIDLRPKTMPRLRNLSSRSMVGGGEEMLIAGLTIETKNPYYSRRLLLRGAGPALDQFGVRSTLPNPVLSLLRADGSTVQRNDDWVDDSYARNYIGKAGAFPFASGSADAIVLNEDPGGSYTLQLRDATGRSGVGLIEAYDVGDVTNPDDSQYAALTNLSLRGKVGAGDASLIAGFIVDDPQNLGRPVRVLVRAVGPTLAQFDVTTPLSNPKLTLYNSASVAFASNDDWSTGSDAAQIAATAKQVGAFDLPSGSKDSALLLDLPPGGYTAIVTDANGTPGIALIELYRVK